jgi:hypothetical protein
MEAFSLYITQDTIFLPSTVWDIYWYDNILYSAELSSDLEIFILVIMYANRTVQN